MLLIFPSVLQLLAQIKEVKDLILQKQKGEVTALKAIICASHGPIMLQLLCDHPASKKVLQSPEGKTALNGALSLALELAIKPAKAVSHIVSLLLRSGASSIIRYYTGGLLFLCFLQANDDKNIAAIVQHFLTHSDFLSQFPTLPQDDQWAIIAAASTKGNQSLLKKLLEKLLEENCHNEKAKCVLEQILKSAMKNNQMDIVEFLLSKKNSLVHIALQEAVRTKQPGIFILRLLKSRASMSESFEATLPGQLVLQYRSSKMPQFFFARPTSATVKIKKEGEEERDEIRVKNIVISDKFFDFVHIIINLSPQLFPHSQEKLKELQTKVLELMMHYVILLGSSGDEKVRGNLPLLWMKIVEALQTQSVDQSFQDFLREQYSMLFAGVISQQFTGGESNSEDDSANQNGDLIYNL